MKRRIDKYLNPKLLLGIVALSGLVAFGAGNGAVSRALNIARPDVKVEIVGTVQRGDKVISLETIDGVKAGEEIDWSMDSSNEGAADAQNYKLVGQIAKGTVFVGTATGDQSPQVTYSIDGGKNYSALPMIDERQTDGSIKKVVAPISLYTQVMFSWATPLAAQSKLHATYRVRVK